MMFSLVVLPAIPSNTVVTNISQLGFFYKDECETLVERKVYSNLWYSVESSLIQEMDE